MNPIKELTPAERVKIQWVLRRIKKARKVHGPWEANWESKTLDMVDGEIKRIGQEIRKSK